jgi:hypothetical protein
MLVNKLTVDDARHFLKGEGGAITAAEFLLQIAATFVVAALTARAIVVGDATVWHLLLPMAAQYVALIAALPIVQVVVRHPDLNKDALAALRLWLLYAFVMAVAVAVRSYQAHTPWQQQLRTDYHAAWNWIVDAEMHWPILVAFLGMALSIPGRVRNLFEHGPPFVGVSLGCAMRLIIIFLGGIAIPWAMSDPSRMAWYLWTVILLAELLALWMHWDIQRRLAKHDALYRSPTQDQPS